jgi:hypothetical protein
MLPTKFQFIWESGFREDFLEINQSKTSGWKVLYKDWSFCPDPLTNMATTGHSSF